MKLPQIPANGICPYCKKKRGQDRQLWTLFPKYVGCKYCFQKFIPNTKERWVFAEEQHRQVKELRKLVAIKKRSIRSMTFNEYVGNRIRQKRNQLGLTQDHIVQECGISPGFLSDCENGKIGIGFANLHKIARVLKTKTHWFIEGWDGQEPAELTELLEHKLLLKVFQTSRDLLLAERASKGSPKFWGLASLKKAHIKAVREVEELYKTGQSPSEITENNATAVN